MTLPRFNSPYRSNWRNRLKDLAIVVAAALVAAAIAELAAGQVIYTRPLYNGEASWPAWYWQGCYTNEWGQPVCNSQMPAPRLAPNVVIAPRSPDQFITRPNDSIYGGRPLPPADPPKTAASNPPKLPPPPKAAPQYSPAEQAKQDAQGWTGTNARDGSSPAPASPPVVVSQPTLIIPGRDPAAAGDFWRQDLTIRVRNAEWAIGGLEKDRLRDLGELRQAIASSVRPLPPLAPATPPLAQLPVAAAPATVSPATVKTIVERVERTGYLELIAQILLVAGGSAATIGTGYGAWILAAKLGVKFLRYAARAFMAHQATPTSSSPGVSSSPTRPMQTYVFDRATQQAVAVDSPPIVDQAPPETHYVAVESNAYARSSQWADEQVARKFADRQATAPEILTARSSLLKQHLASQRS